MPNTIRGSKNNRIGRYKGPRMRNPMIYGKPMAGKEYGIMYQAGFNEAATTTGYQYGYPAYGPVEPDVAAQWIFEEQSGSIIDLVATLTLAVAGSAPTFNQLATGLFTGLSPGIYYPDGTRHEVTSGAGAVGPGAGDLNVEYWFQDKELSSATERLIAHATDTGSGHSWYISHRADSGTKDISFRIVTSAGGVTYAFPTLTSGYNIRDGNLHKVQILVDNGTSIQIKLNNFSLGTQAMTNSGTCDTNRFCIGSQYGGLFHARSALYELRISKNLTNNSGGVGISGQEPGAITFTTFSDGTIIPTTGTPGTFSRASSFWLPTGANTLTEIGTNVPAENVLASYLGETNSSTREGVLLPSLHRNECQQTNQLNNWTIIGTCTVTSNQEEDATGDGGADKITGVSDGDGVKLTLVQNATDFPGAYITGHIWLRGSVGGEVVTFRVKDGGGTYLTSEVNPTLTLTTTRTLYMIAGQTPNPGSGQLIAELIVNGYTVYASGVNLNYTGAAPGWDSNMYATPYLPYKFDIGASREQIEGSFLNYSGTELQKTISALTVSQWVFVPKSYHPFRRADAGVIWTANTSLPAIKAGVCESGSAYFSAYFGSATAVESRVRTDLYAVGDWVNIIYRASSGNNDLFIDGVKVLTTTGTWSDWVLDKLTESDDQTGTSSTPSKWASLLGRQDVWINTFLNDSQVAAHYADTVGGDGLADPTAYYFPTAGATEVIRFDDISGSHTSEILGNVYAYAGLGHDYRLVKGANGLRGTYIGQSRYTETTLGAGLNLSASDNMVAMLQVKYPLSQGENIGSVLFDSTNFGTRAGFLIIMDATVLDFYIYPTTGTRHQARFSHGGNLEDKGMMTFRWVFNASSSADTTLFYKYENQPEQSVVTTTLGVTFDAIGAVTQTGFTARINARSDSDASHGQITYFQLAFAIGSLTYDVTNKP